MISTDNPHHKNEVLMQLFVEGPTWDGNIISKSDRDALVDADLCERWQGWNYLTLDGLKTAVSGGYAAQDWHDKRWYRKATNQ